MMVHMYSPEDIKSLRLNAGLTLAAFGKELNVSESTVFYWEAGKSHPRYNMQLKLAELAKKLRGKKVLAEAV